MKLGVIISSVMNIHEFAGIEDTAMVQTSDRPVKLYYGKKNGKTVVFINRSSTTNDAPHNVDYMANVEALKSSGVTHIISSAVSGSLKGNIREGDLVLLDQFLDFTKRSQFSRFASGDFAFVDFTDPYSDFLRGLFLQSAKELDAAVHPNGCYVGVDGPRFETRAEIKMYGLLGGDVIGMTNVQETILARESGISIASLAYISNMGAGMQEKIISRADNAASVNKNAGILTGIFKMVIDKFTGQTAPAPPELPEIELISHQRPAAYSSNNGHEHSK